MAFKGLSTFEERTTIPEERRPPGSTNAALQQMPVLRDSVNFTGMPLFLPRMGLVVVPHLQHRDTWDCVVVVGNETYPRGRNHVGVSEWELQRAPEMPVSADAPLVVSGELAALTAGVGILLAQISEQAATRAVGAAGNDLLVALAVCRRELRNAQRALRELGEREAGTDA